MANTNPYLPWETPTTLHRAKQLLGTLRRSYTAKLKAEEEFPAERIAYVTDHVHQEWNRLLFEAMEDLAAKGRARTTHFLLAHTPNNRPDGETDMQVVRFKVARTAIFQTLKNCRVYMPTRKQALKHWVNTFLFRLDADTFTPECREHLCTIVERGY